MAVVIKREIADILQESADTCGGCGKPVAEHKIACVGASTRKGESRGDKGECEFCSGPRHNPKEKKPFQSLACAYRTVFGSEADKRAFDLPTLLAITDRLQTAPFRYIHDGADGIVKLAPHAATVKAAKAAAPAPTPAPASAPTPAPAAAPEPIPSTTGRRKRSKAEAKAALAALAS